MSWEKLRNFQVKKKNPWRVVGTFLWAGFCLVLLLLLSYKLMLSLSSTLVVQSMKTKSRDRQRALKLTELPPWKIVLHTGCLCKNKPEINTFPIRIISLRQTYLKSSPKQKLRVVTPEYLEQKMAIRRIYSWIHVTLDPPNSQSKNVI